MQRDKNGISKITLGTAQLGLNYGINSPGQPTKNESFVTKPLYLPKVFQDNSVPPI